jgi:hypothetical protein
VGQAYEGGSVWLLGKVMICESPMKDDVVYNDGRLVVNRVDDVGFRWDEVVCGYDALEFGSERRCLEGHDRNVSLVCESMCNVGDVESICRGGEVCVLVAYRSV